MYFLEHFKEINFKMCPIMVGNLENFRCNLNLNFSQPHLRASEVDGYHDLLTMIGILGIF